MTKILFLIHDLSHGGAEKVLVNLVNNMDPSKFEIHVTAIFGGGINEQFLKPHIHYRAIYPKSFPGNSHVMKLLSPKQLHKLYIKEHYDIEVAYLEGPATRIISGCADPATKTLCWIHCTMQSEADLAIGFRSPAEAKACFSKFDSSVFVSKDVMDAFRQFCPLEHATVLHNTNESEKILAMAGEPVPEGVFRDGELRMIGVGKLEAVKGFDRLARIHVRLRREGYPIHTYILGQGSWKTNLQQFLEQEKMTDSFTFLGYQTSPYKYVKNCDLFVCSSHSEGFSTAATEALIVGTPVCTTRVSGMDELLGNGEYGIITENNEQALYKGIKSLLDDPAKLAHYKEMAGKRGKDFGVEQTTKAVEVFFHKLCRE